MPAVLQLLVRSVPTFAVQQVLEQAIVIWPLVDAREQNAYSGRVRRVLSDLASHEFRGWIEWDNRNRYWRFLQSLGATAGDRMRTFRRLQ